MSIINEFDSVQGKAYSLLSKYPQVRDNDKLLWLAYNCEHNGLKKLLGPKYDEFKAFLLSQDTPMFETLSRVRRKLQENHPHLAGDKAERLAIADEMRDKMSKS